MDLLPGSYSWYSPTANTFAQSFPFHCTDSGKYINNDTYYTKRDNLNSYLLIATDDGCGKMYWKGQSCLLEKGSAVLIDCNTYQEYCTVKGNAWSFYYLHFRALSMEGYKNTLLAKLTPTKLRSQKYFWQLMEEIYQLSHQTDVLSYAAQSNAISNLLTEMLYSLTNDSTVTQQLYRSDITTLAEYIRNHYAEPLRLEDFSQLTHLSKYHLIRLFERQIGMPPYQYLHMCRINQAQHLLRTSDMTISQIAYAIGYNDPVVFTRHFKTFHRITPREYRKECIVMLQDLSKASPTP